MRTIHVQISEDLAYELETRYGPRCLCALVKYCLNELASPTITDLSEFRRRLASGGVATTGPVKAKRLRSGSGRKETGSDDKSRRTDK